MKHDTHSIFRASKWADVIKVLFFTALLACGKTARSDNPTRDVTTADQQEWKYRFTNIDAESLAPLLRQAIGDKDLLLTDSDRVIYVPIRLAYLTKLGLPAQPMAKLGNGGGIALDANGHVIRDFTDMGRLYKFKPATSQGDQNSDCAVVKVTVQSDRVDARVANSFPGSTDTGSDAVKPTILVLDTAKLGNAGGGIFTTAAVQATDADKGLLQTDSDRVIYVPIRLAYLTKLGLPAQPMAKLGNGGGIALDANGHVIRDFTDMGAPAMGGFGTRTIPDSSKHLMPPEDMAKLGNGGGLLQFTAPRGK